MKVKTLILSVLGSAILLCACDNATKVTVPEQGTGRTLWGMGVELDPHFVSQNVIGRNDGATMEDWNNVVVSRVNKMDIQRFRLMLQPHWWEPYNDNDDPNVMDWSKLTLDSPEVQSVCAVLDMVEAMGGDRSVVLVVWGCPVSANCLDPKIGYIGKYFMVSPDGTNWVTRCNDDEEFAENFICFVKWLVEEKGYTCVKEITPYNEPDGNVSTLEHYIPTAKALAARLEKEGLSDRIKLNLSDNIDVGRPFLVGSVDSLAKEAAIFNSHTYIFGYENPNSDALEWERLNVAEADRAGKPHLVGEFGSNQCVGASRQKDINWYKRGVLMVRNAVNFINAGAVGASYWGLLDQYYAYNQSYEHMQQLGLWRYKECAYEPQDLDPNLPSGDYVCRPQYYAYSMLTRFVRKGGEAYPLDLQNDFAAGTAIKSAEGDWTYIFANGSDADCKYSFSNPAEGGSKDCQYYIYKEGQLPQGDAMIESTSVLKSRGGAFCVEVPAQTVVVLRQ